jgi:hypothetical protein
MDESAHTPSMASITLSTNLSDQPEPRLAILDWKISIQEAVHVTGAPLGGDMNHLHSSLTHGDTEYASHAYNYGTQGADPAVPPVLLPRRLPEEIGEYAGPATAANAAAITLHHARVARNAALASFMLKLWLAVMHSLGDDNRAMIRDPVTGFGGFSLRDVVGLIEATYGGTTISTLAVAISRVSTHVYVGDSVQDFNNHSANITRAFRTLEALNNGAAEGTKLVHFMQSIGQNTAALGGANAYINEVPDLSNQTSHGSHDHQDSYLPGQQCACRRQRHSLWSCSASPPHRPHRAAGAADDPGRSPGPCRRTRSRPCRGTQRCPAGHTPKVKTPNSPTSAPHQHVAVLFLPRQM